MHWGWVVFLCLLIVTAPSRAEPEADLLAFTSMRDGNAEIYLVDSNGENLQNLTQHPAEDTHPFWSPDGTKLVFISNRDARAGLYQMDADGSNLQQLMLSEHEIISPSFSPDGTQISYATLETFYVTHLMLMSSDGQDVIELTDDIDSTAWMPDGQHLLGRTRSRQQLVSIDASNGEKTSVYETTVGDFTISPDGTQVAYDYGGEFSTIDVVDLASGDWRMISVGDGGEQTDFGAAWSPDGEHIAYVKKWSGTRYDIHIIEADGSDRPRLSLTFTPEIFHIVDLRWSPDSTRVAFAAPPVQAEEFDILVLDVATDTVLNLSNHPALDTDPVWQPTVQALRER
jgi:TolB protein